MTTSKSTTKAPDQVFIAGRKTIKDWKAFQPTLLPGGDTEPWEKAAKDYFEARLASRYLTPIKTLQQIGSQRGEGFSIVAVQCSLIEFLESPIKAKAIAIAATATPLWDSTNTRTAVAFSSRSSRIVHLSTASLLLRSWHMIFT